MSTLSDKVDQVTSPDPTRPLAPVTSNSNSIVLTNIANSVHNLHHRVNHHAQRTKSVQRHHHQHQHHQQHDDDEDTDESDVDESMPMEIRHVHDVNVHLHSHLSHSNGHSHQHSLQDLLKQDMLNQQIQDERDREYEDARARAGQPKRSRKKDKNYNRKDKSLGLLCDRFVALYMNQDPVGQHPIQLCLDNVASQLGVERRRIYDIVNILEAILIVCRKGKNQYYWFGMSRVVNCLHELHEQLMNSESVNGGQMALGMAMMNQAMLAPGSTDDTMVQLMTQAYAATAAAHAAVNANAESSVTSESDIPNSMAEDDDDKGKRGMKRGRVLQFPGKDNRKDQSLCHLSQIFVQMFLCNDSRIISLEDAARWLLRSSLPGPIPNKTQSIFKSKVRRLYDIANVLCSLKMIEKVHLVQTRKPAFKWVGAGVFPLQSIVSSDAYTRDLPSKRESGIKRKAPSEEIVPKKSRDDDSSSSFSSSRPLSFNYPRPPEPPKNEVIPEAPSPTAPPQIQGANNTSPDMVRAYWCYNFPYSFYLDWHTLTTMAPLEVAYLPYKVPIDLNSNPPPSPSNHTASDAKSSPAYIRDTKKFLAMYGKACSAWQASIPTFAALAEDMQKRWGTPDSPAHTSTNNEHAHPFIPHMPQLEIAGHHSITDPQKLFPPPPPMPMLHHGDFHQDNSS